MLKKTFTFLILVLPFVSLALEMSKALDLYLGMVHEYESGTVRHPFLVRTVESLKDFALYRYYRFLIAGSVDKREATPDIGYYLNLIYSPYNFETEEEQLAAALFLSYLSSKLTRTRLTAEQVMKNASFIDFFTRYRDVVSKEARSFFAWVIAYQLGLTEAKPPLDVVQSYQLEVHDYSFVPPSDLKHLTDLVAFYHDRNIQSVLKQALERVVENAKKDPSRISAHINREASFVARDIVKPITRLQGNVARAVQTMTPAAKNYWWMRFIVYAALLLSAFRFVKIRTVVLSCVLTFESIYIFALFDPTSRYESLVYGLILILGFAFAVLRLVKKRSKWLQMALVLLIVFAVVLPLVVECEELSMEKQQEFVESGYYDLLKRELYMDELSKFSQLARKLSSTMYTSMEDTKATINELVEVLAKLSSHGVVTDVFLSANYGVFFDDRSGFFSYSGSKARLDTFQSLSNTLRFYVLDERSKIKAFERDLNSLLSYSKKLVKYAAPKLREEFRQYVEDLFSTKYPVLSDLLRTFDREIFQNLELTKPPHVRVFNDKRSLSVLLVSILVFLTGVFLHPKISLGPSFVLLVVSIVAWFNANQLTLIVEQTSPLLRLHTSSFVNPLIFITGTIVAIVNVSNFFKLFRRGEQG